MAKDTFHSRVFEVDVLRGVAIILMVIFHFGYDLAAFGWADFNTAVDTEWRVFRAVIVSGFLLAVGMSSYLAYNQRINYKKLLFSVAKLAAVAAFITISSLFMYPNKWVYFGIIHFIAIALFISVFFVRIPKVSGLIGCIIILGYSSGLIDMRPLWLWSVKNISIPSATVDLVSFVPWIGVVLLGIFVMHKGLFNIAVPHNKLSQTCCYLGKHSLLIYLLHQPILYGMLSVVALEIE